MAVIEALPLEEAFASRITKGPSERTLRTHRIEGDVQNVITALINKGAAIISLGEQDKPTGSYLNSFRGALKREGRTDVLVQKRRGKDELVAWFAREEDEARMARRQETGRRMGQFQKERAAARKG